MADETDLLGLLGDHKYKLLGALAELSWSDKVLTDEERGLFMDFAGHLGADPQRAREILEAEPDPERLVLAGVPRKVRALVFTTGVMMVLVDHKFVAAEKQYLAMLAANLGIVPDSAAQTIRDLKRKDDLRKHLREALEEAGPLADRESAEQSAKRTVSLVLGVFVGFGVGVFAWPAVIPGAIVGLAAGAVGGGLVGRILVDKERFDPTDYDFSDL